MCTKSEALFYINKRIRKVTCTHVDGRTLAGLFYVLGLCLFDSSTSVDVLCGPYACSACSELSLFECMIAFSLLSSTSAGGRLACVHIDTAWLELFD